MLSAPDCTYMKCLVCHIQIHARRRSNRFWARLWSDLIIEQTLMRSIKYTSGLTKGRGFEENVTNLWVINTSCSAAVHESMIKRSGVTIGYC